MNEEKYFLISFIVGSISGAIISSIFSLLKGREEKNETIRLYEMHLYQLCQTGSEVYQKLESITSRLDKISSMICKEYKS